MSSAAASDTPGRWLLVALALLVLTVVANNNSGVVALAAIADAFGVGPADVGWVAFGYTAAFAMATILWGVIGQLLGIGRSLAIVAVLLVAGSVIAVVSPTLEVLVFGRLIQGLGAGAVPTLAAAVVTQSYPPHERRAAMGIVFSGMGMGLAVGPMFGATALEITGWHGAVALGLLAIPFVVIARKIPSERSGVWPSMRSIVAIAAFCLAAVFLANRIFVMGVQPITVAAFVIVVVSAAVLVWTPGPRPLIPISAILDPTFSAPTLMSAFGMAGLTGLLVAAPLAQATLNGLDGVQLGLVLLPLALASAATSLLVNRLMTRIGERRTAVLGVIAIGASAASFAATAGASAGLVALLLIPAGAGFGLLRAPLLSLATMSGQPSLRPMLAGAHNLSFFLGGALGGAMVTGVMQPASAGASAATSVTAAGLILLASAVMGVVVAVTLWPRRSAVVRADGAEPARIVDSIRQA